MGAWIEIGKEEGMTDTNDVAPFMGAWIEIGTKGKWKPPLSVAPFMGAWIEIVSAWPIQSPPKCRTLHGCVD